MHCQSETPEGAFGQGDVFFTSKGKLYPLPLERGGCQFVLYNPNSREKQETRVFIDTLRLLANFLGPAQDAVRAYNSSREKLLLPGCGNAEGGDCSSASSRGDEGATGDSERVVLYRRPLTEYSSRGLRMKTELQASVWEERPYIFLKRYWYLEEPGVESKWLPCKGGFQFTLSDSAHDMLAFAQKYEDKFRATREGQPVRLVVRVTVKEEEQANEEEEEEPEPSPAPKRQRRQRLV